jgi:hypothetical protein
LLKQIPAFGGQKPPRLAMPDPRPLLDEAEFAKRFHRFSVSPVPHAVAAVVTAGSEGRDVKLGRA